MRGTRRRSQHQQRVEEFMRKAEQDVPSGPTVPGLEVRRLRAQLVIQEALALIEALGFSWLAELPVDALTSRPLSTERARLLPRADLRSISLEEIAGGCADVSVVTIGTLSACGITDESVLEEVDENDLAKLDPGGYSPPDIARVLAEQRRDNALDLAWGLIANAYGGDWGNAPTEWRRAAERWRDECYT